jgi:O-antigen/teichoic acid export membrane protein
MEQDGAHDANHVSSDPPTTRDAGPAERSLREAAASGAKWTTASAAVTAIAQFIQIVGVAHFLDPRDLGLAAIVVVIVGFSYTFADLGITNAIIAKQTSGPRLSSLYWLNVVSGATVAVLLLALNPVIASIYGEPELKHLLPIAALAFVIMPLGQQFESLMQKELRFAPLALAESFGGIIGAAVAILLAAGGVGAASLVWGFVAMRAVRAGVVILFGWSKWAPRLRFRRDDLRGYIGFGMYQMGAGTAGYLATNVDYLLIGYFLGPGPLGAYTLAYQIVVRPQVQFNPILTRVAFPVFARRQNDDRSLRRGFLELTGVLSLINFPFLVGAAVVAPDLVPAVFGDRWTEAVPLLQILAALGALKALSNPAGSIYLAKLRPDLLFRLSVQWLILVTVSILIGVQAGVTGAASAHVVAVLAICVIILFQIERLIGLRARQYLQALWRPAMLAGAMGVVVLVASPFIDDLIYGRLTALTVEVALGIATYALLLGTFSRAEMRSLWLLFRGRRAGSRANLGAAFGSGS